MLLSGPGLAPMIACTQGWFYCKQASGLVPFVTREQNTLGTASGGMQ